MTTYIYRSWSRTGTLDLPLSSDPVGSNCRRITLVREQQTKNRSGNWNRNKTQAVYSLRVSVHTGVVTGTVSTSQLLYVYIIHFNLSFSYPTVFVSFVSTEIFSFLLTAGPIRVPRKSDRFQNVAEKFWLATVLCYQNTPRHQFARTQQRYYDETDILYSESKFILLQETWCSVQEKKKNIAKNNHRSHGCNRFTLCCSYQ